MDTGRLCWCIDSVAMAAAVSAASRSLCRAPSRAAATEGAASNADMPTRLLYRLICATLRMR